MRLIDADALKTDYGMKDDCEDCEKELKGSVKQCQYNAVYTKMDFCGWIDAMPTIEPESNWISCKERMPEKPYGCLATVWDSTLTGEGDDFENLLPYFVGWDGEQWNDEDGQQCPFEVIAWQPLPEPYKGEGDHHDD